MKNPIGIYENLKEQYFKYIDTAFSVDDSDFKRRRKEVYLPEGKDKNNILAQEPYLELIKPYPSSGQTIKDIKIEDIKDSKGNNYFSNMEELELTPMPTPTMTPTPLPPEWLNEIEKNNN